MIKLLDMLPLKLTLLSLFYSESFNSLATSFTPVWCLHFLPSIVYYLPSFWFSVSLTSSQTLYINISGELWARFLAYLTNRSQFVSTNDYNSYLLPVESGVPQGSILGPLLIIIYMNNIPCTVAHSKVLLFADDTKCFRHIRVPSDMHLLQYDLNCLSCWSLTSLLSFYSSKSTHLSFKCKFITSYYINSHPINFFIHTKIWAFW